MIRKLKTILIFILLGMSFVIANPNMGQLETTGTNLTGENISENEHSVEAIPPEEDLEIAAPYVLSNYTWSPYTFMTAGDELSYVLEDVPFNSARYRIDGYEGSATMDIDVYVKFGAVPTTINYDYKAVNGNPYETAEIEIPEDDEYGDMYILIRCVSGSGNVWARASYVDDYNGCWRSADIRSYSASAWGTTISETDKNDFYKIYVNSGDIITIDAEATSGYSSACVLYDENRVQIASDLSGIWLDITHEVTDFESGYYYIKFYNAGTATNTISVVITQDKADTNNLITGAMPISGTPYTGAMNTGDVNDYYYIYADSGEHITITITLDDPLSSPYYDLFVYTSDYQPNDNYVKSDSTGTTLTVDYYCAEEPTQQADPFTQTKIYLRLWNAAYHYSMGDVDSGYTISITRTYDVANDQLTGCPLFTLWGNSTTPKPGDLNGEADNNDWFRINTKAGYTIKLAVNSTPSIPNPYLDGFLYDNLGNLLISDTSFNITMTYTAPYTGNYYFRIYEAAAAYGYGNYKGTAEYYYYIYTTNNDGNDDFGTAEWVEPNIVIPSAVSVADTDDYYVFEVPSGYQISASGTATGANTDLYLYDSTETQVAWDDNSAWSIDYQHKGLDTELYYLKVQNTGGYAVSTYSLTINLVNIDPDADGSIATATAVPVSTGLNDTGTDSLGSDDINDYYSFTAIAGDKIVASILGNNGLVARIVKDDGSGGEELLAEATITSGTAVVEYYPNAYYIGSTYYLRVCAPDGTPVGAYNWNITIVESDTDDGYWPYATLLEIAPTITETSTLSVTDTNDWYIMKMPSGCTINVTLETTGVADPHFGIQFWGISAPGVIYTSGDLINFNYTYLYYLSTGDVYFQVVNEALTTGDYTLTITVDYIDNDNNGGIDIAQDLPLDTNTEGELDYDDLNDIYKIEVRSGYNLTIMYNSNQTLGFDSGVGLMNSEGVYIYFMISDVGTMTYTNVGLDPEVIYLQFYNPCAFLHLAEVDSPLDYTFNATLVNDDPDGDFDRATSLLLDEPEIINDSLFANQTEPDYSDINDFYVVEMKKKDNLTLDISITGVTDPWFSFYIYDANENIVASVSNGTSLLLTFIANTTGTYYIRAYNLALSDGSYSMTVSLEAGSFFLQEWWLGLPVWAWLAIGGGGLILIIVIVSVSVSVAKKRKVKTR